METISIKEMPKESRLFLIKELGYGSDGEFILEESGEYLIDRYFDIPVSIENMMILPGSTIILDNNELSLSAYLEEFGDVFAWKTCRSVC